MKAKCFVEKSSDSEAIFPLRGATIYIAPLDAKLAVFHHPRAGRAVLGERRERSRMPQRIRLDCSPWDIATASDPRLALEVVCAWLAVKHGVKQERIDKLLADLAVEQREVAPTLSN